MRRIGFALFVTACLAGLVWPGALRAADPGALDAATAAIDRAPTDPDAWMARAELYRARGDFDQALSDLDVAERLAPERTRIAFERGRTLLEALRPDAAVDALDRYTTLRPDDPEGHAAHARALSAVDRSMDAAEAWRQAILTRTVPDPHDYVERARALVRGGPGYIDGALAGLDEGIARVGSDSTAIELEAIDLEVARGDVDHAAERLSRIAERSEQSERWHVRRGELLERAGRPADAVEAYQAALAAIQALPPSQRQVAPTAGLESRARAAVARLAFFAP